MHYITETYFFSRWPELSIRDIVPYVLKLWRALGDWRYQKNWYFWFPHILWVYLTRKTCGQHWFTSLNIYYIGLGHPNVQWLIRFETWHKKIDSNQRVVPILVTYTVTLIFVWIRCQSEGTIWILNWSLPIPKKSWFGAAIWFQEGLKDNILKQKKSNSKFDWQIWWLKLLYKAWTRPRIIHQG